MGIWASTLSPPPTFETPWRKVQWGNSHHDLQYVRNFKPERDKVKQLRVLLYGPIGDGKSSFINSVSTVLRGRMVNKALANAANSEQSSFIKKYETHKIRKESPDSYYPFVFSDTMGLHQGTGRGVRVEDIKLALKGHVEENYKFNPGSPLSTSDPGYNAAPSLDDRVHVLVCVCSGNTADMSASVSNTMREIREAASDLGIPQLAIITKLDEACPETEKDLKNIYKSKVVKKKMTEFSSELGIPLSCILPVKNYSTESSQDPDVDVLILNALKLILDFGNDFIDKLSSSPHSSLQHLSDKDMGGSSSTPSPPPPPSPIFQTPWRKVQWGNSHHDLQYVRELEPERDEVKQLRVLLYGPIGAGKSSFINSVSTVLRGRMVNTALANAANSEQSSFTKKYETHKIRKETPGSYYPFVFNDIMGLEEGTGRGVRVDDIKLAMKGHVREKYKFNPGSPLSTSDNPGYNTTPSPDDRVHVLVCVCSGNAAEISDSVLQKMREIREAASDLGIPQLAIVTKLDEACPETEKDLKNIYKSKVVKRKMTQFSSELGIPLNCILPVKNYSKESSQDPDVDVLILKALKLILDFGNDFIEKL